MGLSEEFCSRHFAIESRSGGGERTLRIKEEDPSVMAGAFLFPHHIIRRQNSEPALG